MELSKSVTNTVSSPLNDAARPGTPPVSYSEVMYERRPVYQQVFDAEGYQKFQEKKVGEFGTAIEQVRQQKEAQLGKEVGGVTRKFQGKERLLSQLESPTISFKKKREAAAVKSIQQKQEEFQATYSSEYEAKKEQVLKEMEDAQASFKSNVLVGYENVPYGTVQREIKQVAAPAMVDLGQVLVKTEISSGKYVGAGGKLYDSQDEAKKSFFAGQNVVFGSVTGLPSVRVPSKEELATYFASSEGKMTAQDLLNVDEARLKESLSKPSQTLVQRFMSPVEVSSEPLKLAKVALEKKPLDRTQKEWEAILTATQTSEEYSKSLASKQQLLQKLYSTQTNKINTILETPQKQIPSTKGLEQSSFGALQKPTPKEKGYAPNIIIGQVTPAEKIEESFIGRTLQIAPKYGQELSAAGRMQIKGLTGIDIEKKVVELPNTGLFIGGFGRAVVAGATYSGEVIDLASETYADYKPELFKKQPDLFKAYTKGQLAFGLSVLKGGQQALGFAGQLAYKPSETIGSIAETAGDVLFYTGISKTIVGAGGKFISRPIESVGELYGMSILEPLGATITRPVTAPISKWLNEPKIIGTPKLGLKQTNILAEDAAKFVVTGKGKFVYTETTRLKDFLYNIGGKYASGKGRGFWTQKPLTRNIGVDFGFDVLQKKSVPKSTLRIEAIAAPPSVEYDILLARQLGFKNTSPIFNLKEKGLKLGVVPKQLKGKPFSLEKSLTPEALEELISKRLSLESQLRGSQTFSGRGIVKFYDAKGKQIDVRLPAFEEIVYGKKAPKVVVQPTKTGLLPGQEIPITSRIKTRVKSFGENKTEGVVSGRFFDDMGEFKQQFTELGVEVNVRGASFKGKPKSVFDAGKVKAFTSTKPIDLSKKITEKKVKPFKATKPIQVSSTLRELQEQYALENFSRQQGLTPSYESLLKVKPSKKIDLTGYVDVSPEIKVTDTLREIATIYKAEQYLIKGKKVPMYVQRKLEPKPLARDIKPFQIREPIKVDRTLRELQLIYSGKEVDVFKVKPIEPFRFVEPMKVSNTLRELAKQYKLEKLAKEGRVLPEPVKALPAPKKFVLSEPIKVDKTLRDMQKIYAEEARVKAETIASEKARQELLERQVTGAKVPIAKSVVKEFYNVYGQGIVLKSPNRFSGLKYGAGALEFETETFYSKSFDAVSLKPEIKNVFNFGEQQKYKSEFKPAYKFETKPQLKVEYFPKIESKFIQEYKPEFKSEYKLEYKPAYKFEFRQKQLEQVKQKQRQSFKQKDLVTATTRAYVSPRVVQPKKGVAKKPFRSKQVFNNNISGAVKAFVPFVRVRGKLVKAGEKTSYGEAFNIGKAFVEKTTARTFILKEAGYTLNKQDLTPDYSGLRAGRKLKGSFVEINKRAINTIGEKIGLRKAKKQKKRGLFG